MTWSRWPSSIACFGGGGRTWSRRTPPRPARWDASRQRWPGRLRAELGLPLDSAAAPVIGTVGRLVPIKAHEVFLAAGAQVLAEVPGALFVIVGEGEREAELKALAAPPPLAGHVHFLG